MAIKSKTVWIAACDIGGCATVWGDDPESAYYFDTSEAATAWVDEGTGWTVDGTRLICPAPDRAHDQARMPGVLL